MLRVIRGALASEEWVLRFIGYSLIAAALALVVVYLSMVFEPPSEVWRPLQTRLLILASVTGMAILIAWLGANLFPRRPRRG
ncbi:MAG: hypothetical protein QXO86_00065 [Nitrososphaerota archaeon]